MPETQLFRKLTSRPEPNGYLQWQDLDPFKSRIETINPSKPHPEADRLLGFLRMPPVPGADEAFS
jgi:hypothetical protein